MEINQVEKLFKIMQEIKDKMYDYKIRSVTTLERKNLPWIFMFEGKDYELKFTFKGGLILRKAENYEYMIDKKKAQPLTSEL